MVLYLFNLQVYYYYSLIIQYFVDLSVSDLWFGIYWCIITVILHINHEL